jgi:hypothetical protein
MPAITLGHHALGWRRLAQSRRRGPGRGVWVFLAARRFAAKTPVRSLGLSWILASESRLFNELRGLKQGNTFSQLFSLALIGATTSECALGHAEAPNCS